MSLKWKANSRCRAPVLYVKGRQHPVKIYYTKAEQEDYLDSALRTFFQIHEEKEMGDVLIFLPGNTSYCFNTSSYILAIGQEHIEGLASTIQLHAKQRPPESLKARSP